ncbi:MAG: sigma-70 family RNA polymerase sigma factor [Planctomycetaceae bacterium]
MLTSDELTTLWKRHSAALLLIARGHCGAIANGAAEDCVQEVFIRLATQEPPPNDPTAWLFTAVRNAAIDAVRSQQRRVKREHAVAVGQPLWLEPIDAASIDRPSADELQQALRQLDDITRDIVVAHLWNDMTFRQIATAFDLSPATAHRKYDAGLAQLRTLMQPAVSTERHATP